MNQETFFENFELLAEAPNGVQKLRELIFQLAVQGKLVPQDSYDVPGSILLAKIKNEKEQLVKEKKIKKSIPIAAVVSNETPYDLPDNWIWVNLDQISNMVHYGYTASANHNLKEIRLLRITDIQKNKVNWDSVPGCEINSNNLDNYKLNNGDLLIARTGGTIGKSYLVDNLTICAVFASYLIRIIPSNFIQPKYMKLFLDSSLYWDQLYAKSMGTGQPNVNGTSLRSLIVPLPPFEEQKRIVAKVDQLMALCDELEARQQKKHEKRIRLNNAALDRLLTAPTSKEFAQYWQRICDNFDLLYDAPETVGQLRQAILQLAVQGKLVVQDEGDEPAAVLLEKIKGEKERLVKEGKISKSKSLPAISVDEIYFELPYGWQWVRFDDICSYTQRGKGPKYVEKSDIPVVSQKCIQWDGFKLDRVRFISPSSLEKYNTERFLRTGDLLWNSTGTGTIGRVNVYVHEDNSYDKVVADSHVTVVRPIFLNSRFIYCWIASPMIQNEIEEMASGTTNQIELNLSTIKNHLVPLPPLQEQHRIVAKVDQLMALCDELEAGLAQAQTEGGKLMEAVVHHVLAV